MNYPLLFPLLLIVSLGAISSTFAQTSSPSPTPTLDQSVTWQNNVQHDGNDPTSPLLPPLALKWKQDLTSSGVTSISYPLIAQGRVIVTTMDDDLSEKSVIAFDETNGEQLWSVSMPGTYGFINAAYDSDKVFVVNFDGLMWALDAASGTQVWSVQLPGQYAFTSPPTAVDGLVFVGGAGSAGTLYAVDENNGNVVWTAFVENGDHSSPAVDSGRVFVSYACPQSYAFTTADGQQLWHYSGPCEGGGGATSVVHLGKVYVRLAYFDPTNGLILDEDTGVSLGGFNSDRPPAFSDNIGVYLQSGTLRGVDILSGQVLWSFAGDGDLTSAPLIVNQTIYIGSSSGLLYGLDLQGHQVWSTQVGSPIPVPDEGNAFLTTGLGAGDGLLVVPAGSILAAYARPSQSLNISTRGQVITEDNVLIGGFIITGNASKNVIIRAIGPSLAVSGPLIDPTMELHLSDGTVITNDNWKVDDASGQSQENEIKATQLAPVDDRESAIVGLLPPGSYTAIVRGKNDATGVGLVEVYDLTLDGSVLGNISTRGYVDTADNVMIGGFILGPDAGPNSRIAIRALGPSLGLSGTLSDPELDLRDSNGDSIATNDNWADDSSQADLVTQQLDPADPSESALIRTLPPGAYTVIVDGHEGSAGIGLVEVYNIGGD
jgi:outer membrane protein assembly factor BamB